MQPFTLYGLDQRQWPISVELLLAEDLDHGPRDLARARLTRFEAVELWSGSKRLLHMTQQEYVRSRPGAG